MTLLIDSSKLISWMRAGRNPVAELAAQFQRGALVSCGLIRVEVLRGLIKEGPKQQMAEFFDLVTEVPMTSAVTKRAAHLAWELDRKGCILPVTDLVIAACALQAGADVVTEDEHFRRIPGLNVRADV